MSKHENKADQLAAYIDDLSNRAKLETWSEFVREINVSNDLYPAIVTNRPALMPKGRALTADECQALYDIISALIETNVALREHAEQTAIMVKQWVNHFTSLHSVANKIENFANFRHERMADEEEIG